MDHFRVALDAKRVVLFVLLCALAACRQGPPSTPATDGVEPSPTVSSTWTPSPSRTPTLTPSLTPTKPTKTPTATATHTYTPAPPTEDPNLFITQAVESLLAQGNPRVLQTSNSPNGEWRLEVLRYDCRRVDEEGPKALEFLNLIEVATGEETTVDTQFQNCDGVGAFGLAVEFWSENSKTLYYTTARESVPDGLCGYWERSLVQFRILNRVKREISLGPLSPDKTRIAFSGGSWGTDLTLWDINEGRLGRVPVKVSGGLIQDIAWAPDGKALAYLQVEEVCGPPGQSSIVRLDVENLQQEILITADSPGFRDLSWKQPDIISLVDENGANWTLTLSTLELVPD